MTIKSSLSVYFHKDSISISLKNIYDVDVCFFSDFLIPEISNSFFTDIINFSILSGNNILACILI